MVYEVSSEPRDSQCCGLIGFKGLVFRNKKNLMLYEMRCDFDAADIEEWMWQRAATRPGYWTISVPLKTGRKSMFSTFEEVVERRVNFTQQEFADLDKCVCNQIYCESKAKIARSTIYQRAYQKWDGGSDDHVAMRAIGAWAMAYYKCQPNKFYSDSKCFGFFPQKRYRTRLTRTDSARTNAQIDGDKSPSADEQLEICNGNKNIDNNNVASPKNKLGYQETGAAYVNEHTGGGNDDCDSEIRATVNGRVIVKECGVGVVGQSTIDSNKKQICGVVTLPISVEPNVYAQESANAKIAVVERIDKNQKPCNPSANAKQRIGRIVRSSISPQKSAPFSAKKIFNMINTLMLTEIRSKKWTEERMLNTIEQLCQKVEPKFKLKASVKLEGMKEEKAPRLLIADQDEGQVMALMTIHIMESLIKAHFPEKGIKGMAKRDAVKRVMKACRVPEGEAKRGVTIFEGDGSAWDTTCTLKLRNMVENPVLDHIASFVDHYLNSTPTSWAAAHAKVNKSEKLNLAYTKNKERCVMVIDSIRRSGHRGTSCLNWWVNYTCWHAAIFEQPERFLDPAVRSGEDITGVKRWLNSAFEGDDSFLSTAPAIKSGDELHTKIMDYWHKLGFNMKIELRNDRALFVGYYMGLDSRGPKFDEEKNAWMLVPEIDRCFGKAGTSCSPAVIDAFNADDRESCLRLAGSAAMSRAFEFSGLCPTISNKFLQYALECDFRMTHDLEMRTGLKAEDKSELCDHITATNAMCDIEDEILLSTGYYASQDEISKFVDNAWHYDSLRDWEGFRETLPLRWRQTVVKSAAGPDVECKDDILSRSCSSSTISTANV